MTRDEIGSLREGWDFEAKLAAGKDGRGAVPDSFWETYSAMANSQGGRVVLGLRELKDGTFDLQGIQDIARVERDLWNALQNRQKVSVNLLSHSDVRSESVDGSALLIITVPRARRQDRPVFIDNDLWAGTFLRIHDGDRHADSDRIRRMVGESTYDSRDERVLAKFGTSDLALETLRDYRNAFRARVPDHPWTDLPDEVFLQNIGVVGHDRDNDQSGLTIAGLLMFGKYESIVAALPTYFVDYQERREGTGAIEWDDRVYPDGTWSGNIYDFFRRVLPKLKADIKVPFRLDSEMMRIDETHVHEAVREALVNTLVHADYEGRISILVTKSRSGFEFRNPGGLRISPEQLRIGGVSDCRNRGLQRMFLLVGFGEHVGSGFSRIERAWREEGWLPPQVIENVELDMTTVALGFDKVAKGTGLDTTSDTTLNDDGFDDSVTAQAILDACKGRYLTVKELLEDTGKSSVTIRRALPGLLKDGRLERRFPDVPNHPRQAYRTLEKSGGGEKS